MERKLPPLWRDLNEIRRLRGLHLLLEALLTGAFTGLVLGAFRLLSILIANFLLERNLINQALEPWLFWGLGLALLAFLSQLFLKIEPLISGSGIPQVELLIRGLLPPMS
ncbi:MAG: chloride channel protein, partial [Desulfovibrionaceae bacterium]|nr:chloride channel protein [Desulfovibrionaceae bacterium]